METGAPSLWHELKRRRVVRALVGYGIAAFAVLQIIEPIMHGLHWQGLRVIGRTSSFSLKGRGDDLRAIGEKLDAATLLEGSVRKSGSRVRITARLIEASGGSDLWSQQFDREMIEVFAVQDEIAKAVVAALKLKLLPRESAAVEEKRTAIPEAHNQFLLGRHFYERASCLRPSPPAARRSSSIRSRPGAGTS